MPSRRRSLAAAAIVTSFLLPASALAAPADVRVRVEGVAGTVFDGVVATDGRTIRAASDGAARRCDGTNLGANPTPGPTATAATVDAMASLGLDFDGDWYDGFDDYFITRWGGERQGAAHWWGILVNRVFTPVGGCQFRVRSGDEVLWVNDAFGGRPFLWLDGPAGAGPVTVRLGAPLTVTVSSTASSTENDQTSGPPYATARVDGVDAKGQPVGAGVVTAGTSGANGKATVTFRQAGWQRVKARATARHPSTGHPAAIPSNSIDVCVEAEAGAGCGERPPSQEPVPVPPPRDVPGPVPPPDTTPVELRQPRIEALGTRDGRVVVRWAVVRTGVGVRGWRIDAKPLGVKGARFATRATGTSTTSAALKLTAGRTHQLRFTLVDRLGRGASTDVGRVLVPVDDRARAFRYRGSWKRAADGSAWRATVSRGTAGSSLRVRLAAGRPVVLVHGAGGARVELRAGGRSELFALGTGRAGQSRAVVGAKRGRAGIVELRVLRGRVSVDGAGVRP